MKQPMKDLFISELKVFKEQWRILGQETQDSIASSQLVKDLLERLKSLRSGAKLAQCDLSSDLLDRLNEALESFYKTDKVTFQSTWTALAQLLQQELEQLTQSPSSPSASSQSSTLSAPLSEPKPLPLSLEQDRTMVDFFLIELESRLEILNKGLLELEQKHLSTGDIEELMRAAHSIKGGARLVGLDLIVQLTHAMEDGFAAIGKGEIKLQESQIEAYLHAIDVLSHLTAVPSFQLQQWVSAQESVIKQIVDEIKTPSLASHLISTEAANFSLSPLHPTRKKDREGRDRFLRVTARSLNRLIGLAGESLIQSRWLPPFSGALMKIKRNQNLLLSSLESLKDSLEDVSIGERSQHYLQEVSRHADDLRQVFSDRLSEFETFSSRFSTLAQRLYQEVISSRMRPFTDGVGAFPRFVRDMAKNLGKQARLILRGLATPVDREILEKLEAPLSHLLRNAVDHGIESPSERLALGKDPEGTIIMEAQHRAGALFITVSDDGRGCNLEALRTNIVKKGLISNEMASHLSEKELLEFLFLPGFSTAEKVTEISGRGVGLSVVQNMVQEVGGDVHVTSIPEKGITFSLQLPLTLSVVRSLLVEISSEIYAIPLSRVHQLLFLNQDQVGNIEEKFYFGLESENVGLVFAQHILGLSSPSILPKSLVVVVLYDQSRRYGIVVDQVIGERELVVRELDPILGKVANVSSGAFMEDGSPILILDVEDIMHSIEKLQQPGPMSTLKEETEDLSPQQKATILIVDDSVTVREVESRLLIKAGYQVETAVDGIDGWNALRTADFDLVITDLDMPRMNGLELVRKIKGDPRFFSLPVIIVSYKEGQAECQRGMEAGADAYMTKGNFKDETLLKIISELLKKSEKASNEGMPS